MSENQNQWYFLRDVASLIGYAANFRGVMLTGGDLYQDNSWHKRYSEHTLERVTGLVTYKTPHLKSGQHPRRKAIDLNLFVDGHYVTHDHEVWYELGDHWKRLDRPNRWGGDFTNRDYNHFERYDEGI